MEQIVFVFGGQGSQYYDMAKVCMQITRYFEIV